MNTWMKNVYSAGNICTAKRKHDSSKLREEKGQRFLPSFSQSSGRGEGIL